ncbi:unnamed protein product [Mesocestoides corti]|uniref:Enkurin domain-containing protein n=1 Tax=Mesocestoides corti TaxID=53468 RepID=A0A0R3U532_MESCO|nr:unnamed protein product [Mesocestoides corti]
MNNKEKAKSSAASGSCCAQLIPNKEVVGTREYIYNLLGQKVSPLNPQKKLPRIRKPPPPLPDAVPKAPHQSMGPPACPQPKKYQLPEKYPFKKKHWRTPFIEKKCMAKKVKLASIAFEKLKLEKPVGRIKDNCCAGVKAPVPRFKRLGRELDENGIPLFCKKDTVYRTNWIERNAIEAITCKPGARLAHPGHRYMVDTRYGEAHALDSNKTHSGLEKCFVYKPAYGKVPKYLKLRAEAIKKTRETYSHYLNEKALQSSDYMLTEKERQDLLNGLKTAWDQYNAKYLGLSSSSTTLKNKTYKQYLEKQLGSLEKDIELVETHPYIFVEADKTPGVGGAVTNGIRA